MASFLLTAQLLINLPGFMSPYGGMFDSQSIVPLWVVAVSGLLAGYGTKMANGCTSGHGISGVGRLSPRSIVAVCTFMATAFLTASLCSPVFPRINKATRQSPNADVTYYSTVAYGFGIGITALFCVATIINVIFVHKDRRKQQTKNLEDNTNKTAAGGGAESSSSDDIEAQKQQQEDYVGAQTLETTLEDDEGSTSSYYFKLLAAMCAAPTFTFGLSFGGMTKPSKIIGFFDLTGFARGDYDPSLLFLFAAGCATSFIAYQFVAGHGVSFIQSRLGDRVRSKAFSGDEYHVSKVKGITMRLVVGSSLFGVSLGIAGFCPTPNLIMAVGGYYDALLIWLPLFIVGRFLHMFCFGDN